jgi:nucleotide-binding universal stress UspA family protein
MSDEEVDIQGLRELAEGKPAERLARVRAAFDAWVEVASGRERISWRDCAGDIEACIQAESADSDLIVIGRPVHLDGRDALHAALFRAGRLVLVAPPAIGEGGLVLGRHILVGWKPCPHAQHAVEAALPWLHAAGRVTVATAENDGSHAYAESARATFAALNVPAEFIEMDRGTESVGLQLLWTSREIGADSLLIGAYQHGVMWEAVLGGVTRDVLSHAEIPVFLMR